MTDRELLQKLTDEFDLFKKETGQIIGDLQRENAALKEKLARYENPKNSGNSGIPPSQDPLRKTKSLRGRSNRPQGGQKGHDGNKLKMTGAPDAVVVHDIEKCSCCGNGCTTNFTLGHLLAQFFDQLLFSTLVGHPELGHLLQAFQGPALARQFQSLLQHIPVGRFHCP